MTTPCHPVSGELAEPLGSIVLGAAPRVCEASDLSIERALVTYLAAQPSISCFLGSRFYPHQIDRGNAVWPAATYFRSSTEHQHVLSGSAGFAIAHISIDIWSPNISDCVQAAEAIRMVLQGFKSNYMGGVGIMSVLLEDESSDCERPADGSGTFYFSQSLDYVVAFVENVPNL